MDPKRVLIVYYSRTGTTREVARAIQNALGCEIERIADYGHRGAALGYLRSSFDSIFRRPTTLRPMDTDPNDYDLVVVGTPVWNASVSTPVGTYLRTNRDRIRRVAFFCTYGGTGSGRALRQMAEASGQPPLLTMALRSDEVTHGAIAARVQAFVSALKAPHERGPAAVKPQAVPG